MTLRSPKEDKRKDPTIDPNPHYWSQMIFKYFKDIIAGCIVLIIVIVLAVIMVINPAKVDFIVETYKTLLLLAAGFIFGNVVK